MIETAPFTTRLYVPASEAGEMIPAGCCPVSASAAVVQLLMFIDGVQDVEVDEAIGNVVITHDPKLVPSAELAEELNALGIMANSPAGAQVDEACAERVQALVRQRVLELFERRGILSSETVAEMQGWGHSGGFSVHAGVRVAAPDRAGRERLLRYCARPMFAGERLVWAGGGAQVRYRLPWAALAGHRRGQQRSIELRLSASEFLDRIAALIPPPRKHRHRYFGVLAPNSPWRAQVTAQAGRKLTAGSKAPRPKPVREVAGATRPGQGARYMWAQLLARIYGVLALQCSRCGGRVHVVGFITEPATVRQILEHVGERTTAPLIAPARSPPLALNGQQLAAPAVTGFGTVLNRINAQRRLSLTYDRGREMAQPARLAEVTGIKVYFADPHSPC